jgi:hypothetical protein
MVKVDACWSPHRMSHGDRMGGGRFHPVQADHPPPRWSVWPSQKPTLVKSGRFSEIAGSLPKGPCGTGFRCLGIHSDKLLSGFRPCDEFRDDPAEVFAKPSCEGSCETGEFHDCGQPGTLADRWGGRLHSPCGAPTGLLVPLPAAASQRSRTGIDPSRAPRLNPRQTGQARDPRLRVTRRGEEIATP